MTSRSLLGGALTVNLMLCLLSSGEPDVERDMVAEVVPLAAPALRLLCLAMFVFFVAGALDGQLVSLPYILFSQQMEWKQNLE